MKHPLSNVFYLSAMFKDLGSERAKCAPRCTFPSVLLEEGNGSGRGLRSLRPHHNEQLGQQISITLSTALRLGRSH